VPFAPHEIENKRFVVALRGYQTDEVQGFLRAIAADYRALLESKDTSPDRWVTEIERVMSSTREDAEREAAEIKAAALAEAAAVREAADRETAAVHRQASAILAAAAAEAAAIRADATREAEVAPQKASEILAAASAEAAEIRAAASREAAELREATQTESEACFDEITRQAEEIRRLESALWTRIHALEHTVVEARQTLAHVSDLYPMGQFGSNGNGYGEAPSRAVPTNVEEAMAAR
jgi:DivIVA domain-containing protein